MTTVNFVLLPLTLTYRVLGLGLGSRVLVNITANGVTRSKAPDTSQYLSAFRATVRLFDM